MHIGETTTRFSSVISRKRNGVNRGGGPLDIDVMAAARAPRSRNACSTSRDEAWRAQPRLSKVIDFERVIRPKAKCKGSMSQKRFTCSNQTSETSAACCVFSTSSRRVASKRWSAPAMSRVPATSA